MADLLKSINANAGFPQGQQVASLALRIQNIKWFSAQEQQGQPFVQHLLSSFGYGFGVSDFTIRWLSLQELPAVIGGLNLAESPLWEPLFPIPELIIQAAETAGRRDELFSMLGDLMVKVFHAAYDGAYQAFEACGEMTLKYAVGSALYISALAVGWAMFAETGEWGENPFLPLIAIFESGYWPIGLYDQGFYVR
ncbi:hypothetical protein ACFQZT_05425 [Paenibacillus sp. GCM10027628]|uniref:hypothetical protein n=1 Tax=Paenibacillus sp. GCM10027628 TaxID=3273413 RepID=UPI00363BF14C